MATAKPHEPHDQRVTNVQIFAELKSLSKDICAHLEADEKHWNDYENRLRELEKSKTGVEKDIGIIASEVNRLRSKSANWDWFNTVMVAISMILGSLGLSGSK